jgi:hypothetical protein
LEVSLTRVKVTLSVFKVETLARLENDQKAFDHSQSILGVTIHINYYEPLNFTYVKELQVKVYYQIF